MAASELRFPAAYGGRRRPVHAGAHRSLDCSGLCASGLRALAGGGGTADGSDCKRDGGDLPVYVLWLFPDRRGSGGGGGYGGLYAAVGLCVFGVYFAVCPLRGGGVHPGKGAEQPQMDGLFDWMAGRVRLSGRSAGLSAGEAGGVRVKPKGCHTLRIMNRRI